MNSAGEGGNDGPAANGGEPTSLELGIWPTFALDPARSRDVQAVTASVAALSAGSTTLPLFERWDALSGATGAPLSVTWSRLDAMIQPYRERRGEVALCIGVVDRSQGAWPFAGGLEGDAAESAMERTLDETFGRYGGVLSHLCFGYELDRYWVLATTGERQQLLAFLKQSVDYAYRHPLRSSRTAIGIALSLGALTGERDVPLAELSLGDELLAVYDPLSNGPTLKDPESVAGELSAALDAVESLSGGDARVPLGLLEVGYPSAAEAGSSEGAQLAYFEALLGAVDERREQLSFVGVFGLGDRASAECEAEAMVFGGSGLSQKERAAARCSMGLRAGGPGAPGESKAAWEPVLAAMSRFR